MLRELVAGLPPTPRPTPPAAFTPPTRPAAALRELLPDDHRHPYDMDAVLEVLLDGGGLSEFQPDHAAELICGTGTLSGHPVAVIANRRGMVADPHGGPPRLGGIVYTGSAEKAAFFIDAVNRRGTPILFVQDVSGFMVGPEAEHNGIIRAGARFVEAMATAVVPKLVLTLNHASGAGYYAMAGQGFDPDFILTLPTGRMGVMEGASAVMALFGAELDRLRAAGEAPDAEMQCRHGGGPGPTTTASWTPPSPRPADSWTRWCFPRNCATGSPCSSGLPPAIRVPTWGRSCSHPGWTGGARDERGVPSHAVPAAPNAPRSPSGSPPGTVRVAGGQGFWGDDLEAPVRQVNGGHIDYLMLDYLAEVTMSIMQKQMSRDPRAGYARDFVPLMERIFPACVERGIGVVTNAGGVNPAECARTVADAGRRAGAGGARGSAW